MTLLFYYFEFNGLDSNITNAKYGYILQVLK